MLGTTVIRPRRRVRSFEDRNPRLRSRVLPLNRAVLIEVNARNRLRILAHQRIFCSRTQIDRAAMSTSLVLLAAVEHRSGSKILNVIILLSWLLLVHLLLS